MYVMQCQGGFNVPIRAGKFEICGIKATVETTSAAARLILADDTGIDTDDKFGRILPQATPYDYKVIFCDVKGLADVDGNLEVLFPEIFKTRNGISAIDTTNIVAGSLMVYVR